MTTSINELHAISARNLCTPIMHEDTEFFYQNEQGDFVGAVGVADYFEGFTVLTHAGGRTVVGDFYRLKPKKLKFRGELVDVKALAPSSYGYARFRIEHGYDHYYPPVEPKGEIGGVDAWSALHPTERQMHLGECESCRGLL